MNSVELIGIVRQVNIDASSKQYLVLEVNRPYLDKKQAPNTDCSASKLLGKFLPFILSPLFNYVHFYC